MAVSNTEYQRNYMRARRAREKEEEAARNYVLRHRWRAAEVKSDPARCLTEWATRYLRIPEGPLRGQPFKLPKWQIRFIREALKPQIQEVGLSISRKNGKTSLCASWALSYLCGPLNTENWRGSVVSLDANLAREFRRAVDLIASASGYENEIRVYKSPMPGRIVGKNGSELDILAASEGSGHARGSDISFIDEAGLLSERDRDLWNAIYTSLSGRNGKLVCLSIQADGPMFAELKERKGDPSVFWMEFASEPEDSIQNRRTWHKSNPGLRDGIKSITYMEAAARRALRSPKDESRFRAYDLNQPRDPERELIVSPDQWAACMTENPPPRAGEAIVGLDLGAGASMTAGACYWPSTGRLEVIAALPSQPSLKRRGEVDGVGNLYSEMERRGELRVMGGLVTPIDEFVKWQWERLEGQIIKGVIADRFKRKDLIQAFKENGLAPPIRFVKMVWVDAAENVRFFQRTVISEKLKCFPSLLMTDAIRNSALERDGLGNEKLDRTRASGKFDALSASVLAVGAAESDFHEGDSEKKRGVLLGIA